MKGVKIFDSVQFSVIVMKMLEIRCRFRAFVVSYLMLLRFSLHQSHRAHCFILRSRLAILSFIKTELTHAELVLRRTSLDPFLPPGQSTATCMTNPSAASLATSMTTLLTTSSNANSLALTLAYVSTPALNGHLISCVNYFIVFSRTHPRLLIQNPFAPLSAVPIVALLHCTTLRVRVLASSFSFRPLDSFSFLSATFLARRVILPSWSARTLELD